jgi:hypothetical protein
MYRENIVIEELRGKADIFMKIQVSPPPVHVITVEMY